MPSPTCDICGKPPYDCPRIWCAACQDNWNGETGCHRSCEAAKATATRATGLMAALIANAERIGAEEDAGA